MTKSIAGGGQRADQRHLWWIVALGFLLLVAGATVLLIILAVVTRTSYLALNYSTEGRTLAYAPNRAVANQPANIPNGGLPSVSESWQDDTGPKATLLESSARPALADGTAHLVIEAIGVDAPILPVGLTELEEAGKKYSQWQVPNAYAVGWHRTSAGLGSPGNTVLNGHNNVYGAVFRDLGELGFGEEIVIYHGQQAHHYQVAYRLLLEDSNQPLNVRLDNAKWMLPTSDERVTLISCWPYVGTTHRLIVIATPADRE